jgi:hypothetical protein
MLKAKTSSINPLKTARMVGFRSKKMLRGCKLLFFLNFAQKRRVNFASHHACIGFTESLSSPGADGAISYEISYT